VVIGMALLTTLIVPPLLPRLLRASDPPDELAADADDDAVLQPT
jgi:hypothetical protein